MYRLIESIKLVDGKFYNLFYHEQRMVRSLKTLFGGKNEIDLEKYLRETNYPERGVYKCRMLYDHTAMETTFTAYEPRVVQQVRIVEDDHIRYDFKFSDRETIDRLFEQRGGCDDILIVRQGMVTDCSFANIVFRKGRTWYTPSTPLLNGTMRQLLLDQNKIQVEKIRKNGIRSFDRFKIINAMLEFDSPEIDVSNIVF